MSSTNPATSYGLHDTCLSAAQQARCGQNPTYVANLVSLCEMRNDEQKLRGHIDFQESPKSSEFNKLWKAKEPEEMEADRLRLLELEKRMFEWDDGLAMLVEGILSRPKVPLMCDGEVCDGLLTTIVVQYWSRGSTD